jgi:hypothetical protein
LLTVIPDEGLSNCARCRIHNVTPRCIVTLANKLQVDLNEGA